MGGLVVSIPRRGFSSLSHNRGGSQLAIPHGCFNPPKGILFIVTHRSPGGSPGGIRRFNPPKGILFIVTR